MGNKQDDNIQPRRMAAAPIMKAQGEQVSHEVDAVALEEPLEIQLSYHHSGKRISESISITMRTPGEDFELAIGFLLAEGIIQSVDDIEIDANRKASDDPNSSNEMLVTLKSGVAVDLKRLERHFYTNSSCGICGRASMDALEIPSSKKIELGTFKVPLKTLLTLDQELRSHQVVFEKTGGLHAAALFDASGKCLALREDVGRHNAVDKLVGAECLAGRTPLSDRILMVSGRTSFEIMQKAAVAGLPVVASVGAPSSMAVTMAKAFGQTLLGFLKNNRFNCYAGEERIICAKNFN